MFKIITYIYFVFNFTVFNISASELYEYEETVRCQFFKTEESFREGLGSKKKSCDDLMNIAKNNSSTETERLAAIFALHDFDCCLRAMLIISNDTGSMIGADDATVDDYMEHLQDYVRKINVKAAAILADYIPRSKTLEKIRMENLENLSNKIMIFS